MAIIISGEGHEPEEIIAHPDVDCWPEVEFDCSERDSISEELEGA